MAYKDIKPMKESPSKVKGRIDTLHGRWYEESCFLLGLKVNVQPSMPRTAIRQTQRTNTPAATPSEYYKCALSIYHCSIIFCLNLKITSVMLVRE